MLSVVDRPEGANTGLRPFDGLYCSPSAINDSDDVLEEDIRLLGSAYSDSDILGRIPCLWKAKGLPWI